MQSKRDKRAALKLMRKLLKKLNCVPDKLVTDDLRSYGRPVVILESLISMNVGGGGTTERRIRTSQPDDESIRCRGSKVRGQPQRFPSFHAATYNTFNVQRHLTSARTHRAFRASARQTWREVTAAD